ncbi:restriction endonuclease subunit S [Enterococcus faecium]|uniref:restriction endonuclease subunit S n=1 Tax=Enterococcus faecium TaxID=1352 RepID=UPI0023B30CE0|nr:restriction endonuclease subunit S [Enterococcus faecium]
MSNDIQPEIRFPGFTEDWEQRKLGDITESFSGGTPTAGKSEYYGGDIPFIRSGEISSELTELFITENGLNNSSAKMVKAGDILYALYGATSGEVSISRINGAINQAILAIRPTKNDNSYLIVQWLRKQKDTIISTYLQGGQGNLSGSIVKDLVITLPQDKEEQNKIGAFFKQLDDTIALHQRKLDLLKETKKGFLQKMFPKNGAKVPEIRFPGFTEDWEERKLGGIGKTYTGLTGKSKEDFGHGDAKFVTYMNVFQNPKATLEQLENVEIDPRQNEVKKGDVFFTTSSETPEEVGMSSVWTHDINNIYLNSFTFAYRPTIKFDLDYLAFMLRSQSVRKKIIYLAQGISRYNISKTKMMDISVPIPVNFEEQQKIGAFFKQLDDIITLHQRKLDLLKETKKGFLQKMFV